MVDTIESFVERIKKAGIDEGHNQAEEICQEAQRRAQKIIDDAQHQADKITSDAHTQAEQLKQKTENELRLAARDTVLHLKNTLSELLTYVFSAPVEDELNNKEFIQPLLRDLVMQYAQSDSNDNDRIVLNLNPEHAKDMLGYAKSDLRKVMNVKHKALEIQNTLKKAGFEYQATEGTVEVTTDSVVDRLAELIGPQFRQWIDDAANPPT